MSNFGRPAGPPTALSTATVRKGGRKSGAQSSIRVAHFSHKSSGIFFIEKHATLQLTKASHAQRTPLNMGALHCVTGGHAHNYTARRTGEVKDMLHPLRLRTITRGFDATVELQQATSSSPVLRSLRRRAGWQRAGAARLRCGHKGEVAAARCRSGELGSHGTPRIPCTCARKKIGAAAVRIDACHKKFPPQLRRKISQRLRRCSAPCKPRWLIQTGALSVPRKRDLSCALAIRAGNFYLCAPLSPAPPLIPPPFLNRYALLPR